MQDMSTPLSVVTDFTPQYVLTPPLIFTKRLPHLKSNNRIMSFRNTISTTALTNVQSYLTHYTRDETRDYIRSALVYHGEVPFLYRVFEPTNVRAKREKGGYKVVSVLQRLLLIQYPHFHR